MVDRVTGDSEKSWILFAFRWQDETNLQILECSLLKQAQSLVGLVPQLAITK